MSAAPTDETLIIETPERVPLHFALASIGNRFLACAFDHFLQIVAMLVVLLLLLWLGDAAGWYTRLRDAPQRVLAAPIVAPFALWSGYSAVFECAGHGHAP